MSLSRAYVGPMPLYVYRCQAGHEFEELEPSTAKTERTCRCGKPASRVLSSVSIRFRGSGFHNTDYPRRKARPGSGARGR